MTKESSAKVITDLEAKSTVELQSILDNLQSIPVADVHGGRQRTSLENEKIAMIKAIIKCR